MVEVVTFMDGINHACAPNNPEHAVCEYGYNCLDYLGVGKYGDGLTDCPDCIKIIEGIQALKNWKADMSMTRADRKYLESKSSGNGDNSEKSE